MTQPQLEKELRERIYTKLIPFIEENFGEVLITAPTELTFPVLDAERNDKFATILLKLPRKNRDGKPYDGYEEAETYRLTVEIEQAEKKAKQEAKEREEKEKQRKRDERQANRLAKLKKAAKIRENEKKEGK